MYPEVMQETQSQGRMLMPVSRGWKYRVEKSDAELRGKRSKLSIQQYLD